MLRWTISLSVAVIFFASTADLMAQRRTPIRNLLRSVGAGWSAGYHHRNPGWDTNYYNPYSPTHNSYIDGQFSDGQIIDGQYFPQNSINTIQPQTAPVQPQPQPPTPETPADAEPDNSAMRLLNQPGQTTGSYPIQHPTTNQQITNQQITNQQINRYLKPYHQNTSAGGVPMNHGGNFQITPTQTPGQIPSGNTGWETRYSQPYQGYTPRN